MAKMAVLSWQSAVGADKLTDKGHDTLEEIFLHELRQNSDGVLVVECSDALTGWGARIPASNYISDLWIDPQCHRQGHGFLLLDALLAQIIFDGFESAEIGTHADNFPAIALYERAGFRTYWLGLEWSESCMRSVEKVHMRMIF